MDNLQNEIGIGVIGAGGRGGLALYAHRPGQGVRITAGADVNPEALSRFNQRCGGDVFTTNDYREIIARPDVHAVFVTSPDYLHEEHAVAALEAGKAVYLEKPMAISIEGCDRILETARSTGTKLYLGHNMRHFGSVLKMKEIIDSGLIGEVRAAWCRHFVSYGGDAYFRDWHSEQRYSTGLLLQKGAHDIDVIHWLTGAYSVAVAAMGSLSVYNNCPRRDESKPGDPSFRTERWPPLEQRGFSPVINVEDHTMLLMQLENGAQAAYLQCHYTPDAWRNYTFVGTRGRIENLGESGDCRIAVYTERSDRFSEPDMVHELNESDEDHVGADPRVVDTFIDFIREGKEPNTSPIAARYAVAAGVLGTESLRNDGGRKTLPRLDESIVAYFENGQKA